MYILGLFKLLGVILAIFLATGITQTVISFIAYRYDRRFVNASITKISVIIYQILGTYSFSMIGALFVTLQIRLTNNSTSFFSYLVVLPLLILLQYYSLKEWKRCQAEAESKITNSKNPEWEANASLGLISVFTMASFITISFVYFSLFKPHIGYLYSDFVNFLVSFIMS
jgi:hypothetical protein